MGELLLFIGVGLGLVVALPALAVGLLAAEARRGLLLAEDARAFERSGSWTSRARDSHAMAAGGDPAVSQADAPALAAETRRAEYPSDSRPASSL